MALSLQDDLTLIIIPGSRYNLASRTLFVDRSRSSTLPAAKPGGGVLASGKQGYGRRSREVAPLPEARLQERASQHAEHVVSTTAAQPYGSSEHPRPALPVRHWYGWSSPQSCCAPSAHRAVGHATPSQVAAPPSGRTEAQSSSEQLGPAQSPPQGTAAHPPVPSQ